MANLTKRDLQVEDKILQEQGHGYFIKMTPSEVARRTRLSISQVKEDIKWLLRSGLMRETANRGLYQLPNNVNQAVEWLVEVWKREDPDLVKKVVEDCGEEYDVDKTLWHYGYEYLKEYDLLKTIRESTKNH